MKNSGKIISALLAGSLVGSISAQDIDHSPVLRTDPFGNFAEAFSNDVNSLFQGATLYSSFTFGWDGSNKATGNIGTGAAAAGVTGSEQLDFTLIPNVAAVVSDTSVFVAYLGNESGDDNFFGYRDPSQFDIFNPAAQNVTLYNYVGNNSASAPDTGVGPVSQPSISNEVYDVAGPGVSVTFWHDDKTDTPGSFIGMNDGARFRTFSATKTVSGPVVNIGGQNLQDVTTFTYYILGVDDRQAIDIDFDDGLFLIQSDEIISRIAVPEPSSIGLLAVGLLAGLGVTRRSRRNS